MKFPMVTKLTIPAFWIAFAFYLFFHAPIHAQKRESIFDRKVKITNELKEVPLVPRWERE